VRQFAGSPVLNLMIWKAAIYCALVVQDIVIVGGAEPWLMSLDENAIASWALIAPDRGYSAALRILG
jgi:hypothetical protein